MLPLTFINWLDPFSIYIYDRPRLYTEPNARNSDRLRLLRALPITWLTVNQSFCIRKLKSRGCICTPRPWTINTPRVEYNLHTCSSRTARRRIWFSYIGNIDAFELKSSNSNGHLDFERPTSTICILNYVLPRNKPYRIVRLRKYKLLNRFEMVSVGNERSELKRRYNWYANGFSLCYHRRKRFSNDCKFQLCSGRGSLFSFVRSS